jgi:hypothetical protein
METTDPGEESSVNRQVTDEANGDHNSTPDPSESPKFDDSQLEALINAPPGADLRTLLELISGLPQDPTIGEHRIVPTLALPTKPPEDEANEPPEEDLTTTLDRLRSFREEAAARGEGDDAPLPDNVAKLLDAFLGTQTSTDALSALIDSGIEDPQAAFIPAKCFTPDIDNGISITTFRKQRESITLPEIFNPWKKILTRYGYSFDGTSMGISSWFIRAPLMRS